MAIPFSSAPTPQASFTRSGRVKQTQYNVRDYGALGDGSTDDTTAINAALAAAITAGGGDVYLSNGTYITSAALTLGTGVRLMGESKKSTIIQNAASTVFTFAANSFWWEVDHLTVIAKTSASHIFTGSHNLSAFSVHDCSLQQVVNTASIWSQSTGAVIEGYFTNCDLNMSGTAPSVPGFDITDTGTGFNANVWEKCVCTTEFASSAYFFSLIATGASVSSYCNTFRDMVFEQCVGGAIFAQSQFQLLLDDVQIWDGSAISNSTADFIHIGTSATGLSSRGVRISNYSRLSSTLGASLYDISFDTNIQQVYCDTLRAAPDNLNINVNSAAGVIIANQSPGTIITNGAVVSIFTGSGNPNSVAIWTARVGDIFVDQAATSGNTLWRCTVAGNPGTWGAIAQNFVDLSTNQNIGGNKTFTGTTLTLNAAGTGFNVISRGANTNYAGFQFDTNNVAKWTLGLRGDSTENMYLFDEVSSASLLYMPSNTGRLGIGKSPATTLDVNGTVTATKVNVATGTNASVGTAVLVAGTVTVATTAITASSIVILTCQVLGTVTVASALTKGTVVAGASFVITSAIATDTSTIGWMIIN